MDWLVSNKLPHKILFYLGFFVVIFFLGLSYWQFSRYQEDRLILMTINEQQISTDINAEDLYITDDLNINIIKKNHANFVDLKCSLFFISKNKNITRKGVKIIDLTAVNP